MNNIRLVLDWKQDVNHNGGLEPQWDAIDGSRYYRIRKEILGDTVLFLLSLWDDTYPPCTIAAKALPRLDQAKALAEEWRGMDIVWNDHERDFELVNRK